MADTKKLQAFVEAALTDPRHPVFKMGMQHSGLLQHYAVNVNLLGAIRPAQWFEEYPEYTAKLEEVMRLCEEDAAEQAGAESEVAALRKQLTDLAAQVAELKKPKEEAKPTEEPPAGE